MKIVFFSYDAPGHISGVDSWLKLILPELVLVGLEVIIVFTTRGDIIELKKVQFFKENKVETYCIPLESYAEQKTRAVLNLLAQLKPDIVIPGYVLAAVNAIKYLKEAGILSACILHSDDEFYNALVEDFIVKNTPWKFDAAVGVSKYLAEKLSRLSLSDKIKPVCHIPYGVPAPVGFATFSNQLNIVYIGRLEDEQKRITELTDAFCNVVNKFPNVTASIYGTGQLKEKVVDLINQCDNSRIAYKGYIDSESVSTVLTQYQVIVLMSDYEGLPVSLLEGMSCGLVPVCLKMQSGINDLIDHMENGIIINNRNSDFFDAISLLQDKVLWENLSNNAIKKIEEGYSIKIAANTWKNFFTEMHDNNNFNRKEITIPRKIDLPLPNAHLFWENSPKPNIFIRGTRWLKRKINRS